ncbi:MAG: hypothetical protein CME59_22835 [Halioglobus sp.]|nr:hypothetical protein [Halioglobus sp.]
MVMCLSAFLLCLTFRILSLGFLSTVYLACLALGLFTVFVGFLLAGFRHNDALSSLMIVSFWLSSQ